MIISYNKQKDHAYTKLFAHEISIAFEQTHFSQLIIYHYIIFSKGHIYPIEDKTEEFIFFEGIISSFRYMYVDIPVCIFSPIETKTLKKL